MSHIRSTAGVRSKRTYVSFLFRVKRVGQSALQELNFISQFNFSLVLLDIVALNKTLGESALPGNFFFAIICIQAFCLDPLPWRSSVFLFQFCLWFAFHLCHHTGQAIFSPDLALGPSYGWWMFLSDTIVNKPKEQQQNIEHWIFHYWVKVH